MASQTDGFYLVNCSRNFLSSSPGSEVLRNASGIAYYADMFANHNNQNEQPTNFVYTDNAGNTQWETGIAQQANFQDTPACPAFTFSWTIGINAQTETNGTIVGSATSNLNGEEHFTIFKDNGRLLVTRPDEYQCFCIYLCQKTS